MGEILYRQFLQYFRNPMYFSIYILQVAFHPIALGQASSPAPWKQGSRRLFGYFQPPPA
jgi:hypothetical protein